MMVHAKIINEESNKGYKLTVKNTFLNVSLVNDLVEDQYSKSAPAAYYFPEKFNSPNILLKRNEEQNKQFGDQSANNQFSSLSGNSMEKLTPRNQIEDEEEEEENEFKDEPSPNEEYDEDIDYTSPYEDLNPYSDHTSETYSDKASLELKKLLRVGEPFHFDNQNSKLRDEFDLDIDAVLGGKDRRTTLMIKNIPNKYSQKMLLESLHQHRGNFDFFYLPIDFKNKCNVGYAFINFIKPEYIVPFFQEFNGQTWEKFNSQKVCSISYARIQGKQSMISHFQNSRLLAEDKKCRPLLFISDGPNAGEEEEFPLGPNFPYARHIPSFRDEPRALRHYDRATHHTQAGWRRRK